MYRFIVPKLILLLCAFLSFGQQVDRSFKPGIFSNPKITALAVQSDGKILVAGNIVAVGGQSVNGLVRLNEDGTLDQSFRTSAIINPRSYVNTILIDGLGKILVGGQLNDTSYGIRLNQDGSLDESFRLSSAINQTVFRFYALDNNRFLVFSLAYKYIHVINYDGSLDPSFDAGTGPDGMSIYNDFAVQSDGKIIFGGHFKTFNNTSANGILRLNTDGSIDDTFMIGTGLSGTVQPHINDIKIDDQGRIVLAGAFTAFNNIPAKNIVRLLPDGSVDPDFMLPGPAGNYYTTQIGTIELIDNGILTAGMQYDQGDLSYNIVKLHTDGSLDTGFDILNVPIPPSTSADVPILIRKGSSVLFSGGFENINSLARRCIALISSDGVVDDMFNPALGGLAGIDAIVVQGDGKLLIGGRFDYVDSTPIKNFTRLNTDGSLDETFQQTTDRFLGEFGSLKQDSNGKIYVGGKFKTLDGTRLLVKLNPDGSEDSNFAPDFFGNMVTTIELASQGNLVIGGEFSSVNGEPINNIVRLYNDGTTDDTFNKNLLNSSQVVYSLAQQSNGNLLIGGMKKSTDECVLYLTDNNGALIEDINDVSLTNQSIRMIKVMEDDSFFAGGYFARYFDPRSPNALFQFSASGDLVDKSMVVYNGGITHLEILNDGNLLLAGGFDKVKEIDKSGLVLFTADGQIMSTDFKLFYGGVSEVVKTNQSSGEYFVAGGFFSLDRVDLFSLSRINFDIPASVTELVYDLDNIEGRIELSWDDNAFNETHFLILRRENDGPLEAIDTVLSNITSYTDLSAVPLRQYEYVVKAFNTLKISAASNSVIVSTHHWVSPSAPVNLSQTIADDYSTVNLSWTDTSENEMGFELERSVDGGDFELLVMIDKNTDSATDDLLFGTQYDYRLRAYNKFGKSPYSNVVEIPLIVNVSPEATYSDLVYPNPVTGNTVYVGNKNQNDVKITLISSASEIISQKMTREDLITLDFQFISAGIYLLRVEKRGKVRFVKLVKY